MKKLILTSILLACNALVFAESVETTAAFRNMMKREYNVTVPKKSCLPMHNPHKFVTDWM